MHSRKAIAKLLEGSYYDRITAHIRHGIKAPLSEEDTQIFEIIERAKDLWLHHKDDKMVVNILIDELSISRSQAYVYLSDAKSIYTLFLAFNPITELLILKERIDEAFTLARNSEKYAKLYSAALLAYKEWIKDMTQEMERIKPEEQKQVTFQYHNDFLKIPGITKEIIDQWDNEFDKLEVEARKRFKHLNISDVQFTESRD